MEERENTKRANKKLQKLNKINVIVYAMHFLKTKILNKIKNKLHELEDLIFVFKFEKKLNLLLKMLDSL